MQRVRAPYFKGCHAALSMMRSVATLMTSWTLPGHGNQATQAPPAPAPTMTTLMAPQEVCCYCFILLLRWWWWTQKAGHTGTTGIGLSDDHSNCSARSMLIVILSLSTKTECGYLYGWVKKQSHTQKSHPKMVNPRDLAGEHRRKRRILSLLLYTFVVVVAVMNTGSEPRMDCEYIFAQPCDRMVRRYMIYWLRWGLVPSDFEGLVFFVRVVSPRPVACQGWWVCPTQVCTKSFPSQRGNYIWPHPPSQPLGAFSSSACSTAGSYILVYVLFCLHSRWESSLPPDQPLGQNITCMTSSTIPAIGSFLLFRLIHRWVAEVLYTQPLSQPLGVSSSSAWSTVGSHKSCKTSSAFAAIGSFLLFCLIHRWVT